MSTRKIVMQRRIRSAARFVLCGSLLATAACSGDGDGSDDTAMYPLGVGYTWTHKLIPQETNAGAGFNLSFDGCEGETVGFTRTIISSQVIGGEEGFEERTTGSSTLCSRSSGFSRTEGDTLYSYDESSGAWQALLVGPMEDGHTWTTTIDEKTYELAWRSAGSITVPAGTFSDCWDLLVNSDDTSYSSYCRGVGHVRVHWEHASHDLELVSTSF